MTTTLLWIRRDLRLADHPALSAACQSGAVIPVFIRDSQVDDLGAAPKWRLGLGIAQFAARLEAKGSRVVLRSGKALDVLRDLIAQTGATQVFWTRAYDPASIARDTEIKTALKVDGVSARQNGE